MRFESEHMRTSKTGRRDTLRGRYAMYTVSMGAKSCLWQVTDAAIENSTFTTAL